MERIGNEGKESCGDVLIRKWMTKRAIRLFY